MRKNSTRKNGGGFGKALKHFVVGSKAEKLWIAAYEGDLDKVKKEVEKGASINKKYENVLLDEILNNTTPLMVAANQGNKEIVEYLLGKGADPNIVRKDGKTAYNFAMKEDHTATAEVLKNYKNNSNNKKNNNKKNHNKKNNTKKNTKKNNNNNSTPKYNKKRVEFNVMPVRNW